MRRRRPARRGLAPLELVLAVPMLLTLVVALYMIGWIDVTRCGAVAKARSDAWVKRAEAPPGKRLAVRHDPNDSLADGVVKPRYRPGLWFGDRVYVARTECHLVANVWDHQSVPFRPNATSYRPHLQVAGWIADNVGLGGLVAAVAGGFSALFGSVL